MLSSMTAFSREEHTFSNGSILWEMRSVNQRFLEISFKLPDSVKQLEPILRDKLRSLLFRGKIDCFCKIEILTQNEQKLKINEIVAQNLLDSVDWLRNKIETLPIDPIQFLNVKNVLEFVEQENIIDEQIIFNSLENAAKKLIKMRENEGKTIENLLQKRLNLIAEEIKTIRNDLPTILALQKEKLLLRFNEFDFNLDEKRIEQEIVLLIQKMDIEEELDRLDSHLFETNLLILKNKNQPIGRKLDFLMQEFNREANTLSAKSMDKKTTNSAINIKVLIEQMREQIQNVE